MKRLPSDPITLVAVGDVWSPRVGSWPAFDLTHELLAAGHVRFANCEGVYADDVVATTTSLALIAPEEASKGLAGQGFDVMSCANNHILDGGADGLRSTIGALRALGIATTGAGTALSEAESPAIVDVEGSRIAFLAFSSVHPNAYAASHDRPGLNPLATDPPDTDRLGRLVSSAADRADYVIVSMHWGNGVTPMHLNDYERVLARRAIDQGAHSVICHHHHCVRGIDIHKGRPIFHGVGHFAFEIPGLDRLGGEEFLAEQRKRNGDYAMYERKGFPSLPFHEESRSSMVAIVNLHGGEVCGFGFVPCALHPDSRVEPLDASTPAGAAVVDYITAATAAAGLPTSYRIEGELAGISVVRPLHPEDGQRWTGRPDGIDVPGHSALTAD